MWWGSAWVELTRPGCNTVWARGLAVVSGARDAGVEGCPVVVVRACDGGSGPRSPAYCIRVTRGLVVPPLVQARRARLGVCWRWCTAASRGTLQLGPGARMRVTGPGAKHIGAVAPGCR